MARPQVIMPCTIKSKTNYTNVNLLRFFSQLKRQLDFGGPPPRQSGGRGRGASNLSAFSPGVPAKVSSQSFRPQEEFDDGGHHPSDSLPGGSSSEGADDLR